MAEQQQRSSGASQQPSYADLEWARNVRHRDNPNVVGTPGAPTDDRQGVPHPSQRGPAPKAESDVQVSSGRAGGAPRPGGFPADPATVNVRPGTTPATFQPGGVTDGRAQPSYYDIPLLKSPLWKWEIASYFFLGGLSAGAYSLSRVAARHGGEEYREVARTGAYVAFLSMLACPPLLIHDLGDPKRFHHMLRIWKPSSPMSLGSWVLTAYGGAAAVTAAREYLKDHPDSPLAVKLPKMAAKSLIVLHDAAGIPLALLLAGYTGVLLSCTSNPMWCKNPWIGALFSASSASSGAAATSLAMDLTGASGGHEAAHHALEKVDTVAHVAEAVSLVGYLKHAGEGAAPLTRGTMKRHFWAIIVGLIAAEVCKLLPLRGPAKRWARMAGSAIGLASGFSLRWAFVYGGHEAANDPHLSRLPSTPKKHSLGAQNGTAFTGA